jgi:hypothetical protein
MPEFNACQITGCNFFGKKMNVDRKFIRFHYTKHMRRDINRVAQEMNITLYPYKETRYALVNQIIDKSKWLWD